MQYQYNAALRPEYVGNGLGEFVHNAFNVSTRTWTTSSSRNVPSWNGSVPVANAGGSFSAMQQIDSLGRLLFEQGNNGQSVRYSYDNNGNLLTRTEAANRVTQYQYNPANHLDRLTNADNGTTTYNYNAAGFLTSVSDPRGLITSYDHNGFGEKTSINSPDSGVTNFDIDSGGRITTATTSRLNIIYGWDALGRMTSRSSAG